MSKEFYNKDVDAAVAARVKQAVDTAVAQLADKLEADRMPLNDSEKEETRKMLYEFLQKKQ
jgi:hypothetical protein